MKLGALVTPCPRARSPFLSKSILTKEILPGSERELEKDSKIEESVSLLSDDVENTK